MTAQPTMLGAEEKREVGEDITPRTRRLDLRILKGVKHK